MNNDTIVAISTAVGEAAIGIIRLSGEDAVDIVEPLFRSKSGKSLSQARSHQLVYGHIVEGGTVLDEVFVTHMVPPATYTREAIVEINCHGGVIPMNQILKLLVRQGARLAEPGEFTKRAFLNGRLDLAQAEAVMDLVSARTPSGFDVAFSQLEGKLSLQVKALREIVMMVMAKIEVGIDYPEEDIEEITYEEVESQLERMRDEIGRILKSAETGKVLREGLHTVIVGKPNVGKSSLMNALLRESRAIVTDIPGTTRDIIEEHLHIRGIPLKIVDTAGIRETDDVIEKMGVMRSKEYFNRADLIILVLNAAEELTEEDRMIMDLIRDRHTIVLVNKTDLPQKVEIEAIREIVGNKTVIPASIALEHGLDELEDHIVKMVYGGEIEQVNESPMVSNVRHISALEKAYSQIESAVKATQDRMPYDFIEVDIKDTFESLGEVLGETIEEDVISKIFSQFCIGK